MRTWWIYGIPVQEKRCRGPLCKGSWRPVSEFQEIPPPTRDVYAETQATPTTFKYYHSRCRKCRSWKLSKSKGKVNYIPESQVSIYPVQGWVDELYSRAGQCSREVCRLTGLKNSTLLKIRGGTHKTVRKELATMILVGLLRARRPGYKPVDKIVGHSQLKLSARQQRMRNAEKTDVSLVLEVYREPVAV